MSATEQQEITTLCTRAYQEDFTSILPSFPEAIHILARTGTEARIVSHALWVTRWLQVGSSAPLRTAYVEAVATDPDYARRGYASAVLRRLAQEIGDFELGGLSPSDPVFYERLGWELWQGPLFIRKGTELLPSPQDEQVMILRLRTTPPLDLTAPLSAEWREGELW
jgi:aminoglycoside 2'-N-acetyltransferase I